MRDSSETAAAVAGVRHGGRRAAAGRWAILAAAVLWGLSATLARFVFRDRDVPPLTAVELRLVFAVLVLLPWMLVVRRDSLRIARSDAGGLLVLGLFGVAAVQGSYYFAIARLGVGLAILLQYLAPTLVVLWDVVRGRPVRRATWGSIACALLGTTLLVGAVDPRTLRADPLGWAVGFSSAAIFAFYIVRTKAALARHPAETVLLYTFAIAAVFWGFVTPPWRILAAHYPPDLWVMFLALGLFSTLVPFALFNLGLARVSAVEAGILATSEPVIAVAAAALFLGEHPTPVQVLGAAFVLVAAVLATLGGAPEAPQPGQG